MGCRPVLSAASGPAGARVLLVGEAPGRLGAARTGVPFMGDVAGSRFERLLAEARLSRGDVFITNAVLCLPLDGRGRNRRPASAEVRACSRWLAATIETVDPGIVVAMGATALRAIGLVGAHTATLRSAGSAPEEWNGRWLAAVYHPGARAQAHRTWEQQAGDWRALGKFVAENC